MLIQRFRISCNTPGCQREREVGVEHTALRLPILLLLQSECKQTGFIVDTDRSRRETLCFFRVCIMLNLQVPAASKRDHDKMLYDFTLALDKLEGVRVTDMPPVGKSSRLPLTSIYSCNAMCARS